MLRGRARIRNTAEGRPLMTSGKLLNSIVAVPRGDSGDFRRFSQIWQGLTACLLVLAWCHMRCGVRQELTGSP
jgi:hypothetical protein